MAVKVTKAIAQKRLADVPQGKAFYCSDGRALKNLRELESALKEMSDGTFRYHANQAKNDFAKWTLEVIGDDKLTGDLQQSASRFQAAAAVAARISWLQAK